MISIRKLSSIKPRILIWILFERWILPVGQCFRHFKRRYVSRIIWASSIDRATKRRKSNVEMHSVGKRSGKHVSWILSRETKGLIARCGLISRQCTYLTRVFLFSERNIKQNLAQRSRFLFRDPKSYSSISEVRPQITNFLVQRTSQTTNFTDKRISGWNVGNNR